MLAAVGADVIYAPGLGVWWVLQDVSGASENIEGYTRVFAFIRHEWRGVVIGGGHGKGWANEQLGYYWQ